MSQGGPFNQKYVWRCRQYRNNWRKIRIESKHLCYRNLFLGWGGTVPPVSLGGEGRAGTVGGKSMLKSVNIHRADKTVQTVVKSVVKLRSFG